nr:allergen Tha p 1-like [Maniola hyperantus]
MISKSCVVLFCLLGAVLAEEKYSDKYDNFDLNEVLQNKRLLQSYANCILDKGKCTPEGKELREHIQDALETGCKKCTDAQSKGATTVINHVIENEPEIWKELTAKYDPQGIWLKKYEDLAKERGIAIPKE